ncbi:UNVERIFIED_CONTAM: hypothetical protein NCL1_43291 [Trichonephila clavipes]
MNQYIFVFQFNVWNYGLSEEEIRQVSSSCGIVGNVLPWKTALNHIHGSVTISKNSQLCKAPTPRLAVIMVKREPAPIDNRRTCMKRILSPRPVLREGDKRNRWRDGQILVHAPKNNAIVSTQPKKQVLKEIS